jgi:TPR repeat protein
MNKGDNNATGNLASLLCEIDRTDEAEIYYKMAIEQGNINALNNYANLLGETNRMEEAEKYYKLAIERVITKLYLILLVFTMKQSGSQKLRSIIKRRLRKVMLKPCSAWLIFIV